MFMDVVSNLKGWCGPHRVVQVFMQGAVHVHIVQELLVWGGPALDQKCLLGA